MKTAQELRAGNVIMADGVPLVVVKAEKLVNRCAKRDYLRCWRQI